MSSFQDRFKRAIGPRGYEVCMRRSVQTVILYEAYRCIESRISALRPFQRKFAFWDQAVALLRQSDLLPHQREEILWRTGTSKEPMQIDTAWKRMKLIEKEIEKLIEEKVKPLYAEGKTHEEICSEFVQKQYESVTGQIGKDCPCNWEHSHNNVIMAYKMYYDGLDLDSSFPEAKPPVEISVPHEKPKAMEGDCDCSPPLKKVPVSVRYRTVSNRDGTIDVVARTTTAIGVPAAAPSAAAAAAAVTSFKDDRFYDPADDFPGQRRLLLQEISQHMELLDKFDGVVHADLIKKRKRELFDALPPIPPSTVVRGSAKRKN